MMVNKSIVGVAKNKTKWLLIYGTITIIITAEFLLVKILVVANLEFEILKIDKQLF